ncbi:MAG: TonB-dependent receptor [Novosphingobium sp.]|nr:TonB-dependent receptor [Novosphingobium sp.]
MSTALFSALIATSSGVAAPALAQDVSASDDEYGDAIVVTARRREETLIEVPMAVSAFSAQALESQGITNISEIAQSAPSVTIEPSRATNSTLTAFIRGVGQQDPLAGFEPGVALYIDDVYMARPQGALLDVYDVERIEILRGPQGTLYGRNAVGGAIKYVTRKLPDQPSLDLRFSIGSYNQIDAVAKVSAPLTDAIRVGLAAATLNRDGYGENFTTGQDNYNKNVKALRGTIELTPSDALFVRISGDYSVDTSNPVAGYRPYPGAVSGTPVTDSVYDTYAGAATNPSTAGIDGRNRIEAGGVHGLVEFEASDAITLKSITAWRKDKTRSVIDFDSLAVDDFDAPVIYDNEQFSQELQLLYQSDRLNGVVGFYYLDAKAANDFDVVLGQLGRFAFGAPLTAYTGGSVDTKAWSVFADLTYDLTDMLSVTLGGRYTHDKRSADIFRANYLGLGSPFFGNENAIFLAATSDYEASRTFKNFSPRAVISFQPNPDLNFYASWSRGFKAGSFDPRGANFSTPEVEQGYKPEILDSYEAGVKARFGRGYVNLAAFYSDYKDLQVPGSLAIDTDGDGIDDDFVGAVTNAGKARIMGIELEGNVELVEGFRLIANGSLLDPEYRTFIVNGENLADQRRIQNTPKFQSYVALAYSGDLGNGRINVIGSWSHKSSITQFETPTPDIDQKAYDLFDASVVWKLDSGLSLGVHGKNLAGKQYKTSGYFFPTLGLENNITAFYGPPRTFTFTIGYQY